LKASNGRRLFFRHGSLDSRGMSITRPNETEKVSKVKKLVETKTNWDFLVGIKLGMSFLALSN
jgi:hypothetical protein